MVVLAVLIFFKIVWKKFNGVAKLFLWLSLILSILSIFRQLLLNSFILSDVLTPNFGHLVLFVFIHIISGYLGYVDSRSPGFIVRRNVLLILPLSLVLVGLVIFNSFCYWKESGSISYTSLYDEFADKELLIKHLAPNSLVKWGLIIIQYLGTALIYYMFKYKPLNSRRVQFIILCFFLFGVIIGLRSGQRGQIYNSILTFFYCIYFFKLNLPRSVRYIGLVGLIVILWSLFDMTTDRFYYLEASDIPINFALFNVVDYFGQPFYFFSNFVLDVDVHSYGAYLFYNFFDKDNIRILESWPELGTSWFTFIGPWFLDFGIMGLLALAFIILSLRLLDRDRYNFLHFSAGHYLLTHLLIQGHNLHFEILSYLFSGIFLLIAQSNYHVDTVFGEEN